VLVRFYGKSFPLTVLEMNNEELLDILIASDSSLAKDWLLPDCKHPRQFTAFNNKEICQTQHRKYEERTEHP
jgi:hypothetical protein